MFRYGSSAVMNRLTKGDGAELVPTLTLSAFALAGRVFVSFLAMANVTALARAPHFAAPPDRSSPTVPAGTILYLRLKTPVSTTAAHLHQAIVAEVVREVNEPKGVVIPLGTIVEGRIEKLVPSSNPADRALLRLNFTRLELPGEKSHSICGHVKAVDNARETVLNDGTIQGLLASELPVSRINDGLTKLAKTHPELGTEIQKIAGKNFGRASTAIEYAAGTDLEFVLDRPLALTATFPPAAPAALPAELAAAVSRLLSDHAPQRATSKDGTPGDPLNLVIIGSAAEIRRAFEEAGWSEAEQKTSKSIWDTIRAVMDDEGYGQAPVSQLYLYGRPEDLAFEKTLNTFTKRHHLRLWRTGVTTIDGREIWVGAATHDIGFDIHPGVASHATDPDLDDERAKVGADLLASGNVASEQLVTRPDPLCRGTTATGGAWRTDGLLLAIALKPSEAAERTPDFH